MTRIAPQRAEIFFRQSNKNGVLMFSGIMSGPTLPIFEGALSQSQDAMSLLIAQPDAPLSFKATQGLPEHPDRRELADLTCSDLGAAPCISLWHRVDPDQKVVTMQFVIRQVLGHSDLHMISGVLQDLNGLLPKAFHGNEQVIEAQVDPSGLVLNVTSLRSARDVSHGEALSAILKKPIWSLGASEPWALTWTVRADIAAKGIEASKLREKILIGEASSEDENRFDALKQETNWLVNLNRNEQTFVKFIQALHDLGGAPEPADPALITLGEIEAQDARIQSAVEKAFYDL